MLKRKSVREKGKIRFSEYYKDLKDGDKISVIRELSIPSGFPKRIQGRTGHVVGKRGTAYVVNINDKKKMKQYTIKAIHLKRI